MGFFSGLLHVADNMVAVNSLYAEVRKIVLANERVDIFTVPEPRKAQIYECIKRQYLDYHGSASTIAESYPMMVLISVESEIEYQNDAKVAAAQAQALADKTRALAEQGNGNEQHNVLSDPIQRKAYDKSRGGKEGDFGDWVHEEESDQAANSFDPLEKDWAWAVGYYPDLVAINNRLSKISNILAFSYRAELLDIKAFEKRKGLAQELENKFLQLYFGSNPEIVDFALQLILVGNKAAAKALNKTICLLGSDTPAKVVIDKISKDFINREIDCPGCKRELLYQQLGDLHCRCKTCEATFWLSATDEISGIYINHAEASPAREKEKKYQSIIFSYCLICLFGYVVYKVSRYLNGT